MVDFQKGVWFPQVKKLKDEALRMKHDLEKLRHPASGNDEDIKERLVLHILIREKQRTMHPYCSGHDQQLVQRWAQLRNFDDKDKRNDRDAKRDEVDSQAKSQMQRVAREQIRKMLDDGGEGI